MIDWIMIDLCPAKSNQANFSLDRTSIQDRPCTLSLLVSRRSSRSSAHSRSPHIYLTEDSSIDYTILIFRPSVFQNSYCPRTILSLGWGLGGAKPNPDAKDPSLFLNSSYGLNIFNFSLLQGSGLRYVGSLPNHKNGYFFNR